MAYQDEVLADAPVGYWRMNEASGTTLLDSSGANRHGTYAGGYTLFQQSGIGNSGAMVYFNGTSGYASVPHDNAFNLTGDFTLEAWVYPLNFTAFHLVMTKATGGGSTNDTFNFQITPSGTAPSSTDTAPRPTPIKDGRVIAPGATPPA
jgi:hypothetical protein